MQQSLRRVHPSTSADARFVAAIAFDTAADSSLSEPGIDDEGLKRPSSLWQRVLPCAEASHNSLLATRSLVLFVELDRRSLRWRAVCLPAVSEECDTGFHGEPR